MLNTYTLDIPESLKRTLHSAVLIFEVLGSKSAKNSKLV